MADTMSEAGAIALRDQINAYWRERGYDAQARVEVFSFKERRARFFDVRSAMVNGLPARRIRDRAA